MGLAVGALLPSASASEFSRRTRLSLVVVLSAIVLFASAAATFRLRAGVSELASSPAETTIKPSPNCSN